MSNLKNHAPRKGEETWSPQGGGLEWQCSVVLPIQGKSETEYQPTAINNNSFNTFQEYVIK
jgi:hypothetical protein